LRQFSRQRRQGACAIQLLQRLAQLVHRAFDFLFAGAVQRLPSVRIPPISVTLAAAMPEFGAGGAQSSSRHVDRADFLIKTRKAATCLAGELEPARIAQDGVVIAQLILDQPRKHAGNVHHLVAAKAARPEALVKIDVVFRSAFAVFLQPLDALGLDLLVFAHRPCLQKLPSGAAVQQYWSILQLANSRLAGAPPDRQTADRVPSR
jgi:hypothetical protein